MKPRGEIVSFITCLITDGTFTNENCVEKTTSTLETLKAAIEAQVSLFQIREKRLSAKNLLAFATTLAQTARGSKTKIFVNDRSDIAAAAGADGVQLTEASLPADVVRKFFPDLLIGVSTHSAESFVIAANDGADFAIFGPVFETPGKENAQGLDKLRTACDAAPNFPLVAIGGIDQTNLRQIFEAGASGFASIRFLNRKENLLKMNDLLREVTN